MLINYQKSGVNMNKFWIPILAIFASTLLTTAVFADSPHFLFADNSVSTSTGALTTSFKDAGLGTGTTSIQITLSVKTATAVYQCFNNGGNHPKAGNKETVGGPVSNGGQFPVRNGQTTGSCPRSVEAGRKIGVAACPIPSVSCDHCLMAVALDTTPCMMFPTALKLVVMISIRLPESETAKLCVPVATRVAPALLKTTPLQPPP